MIKPILVFSVIASVQLLCFPDQKLEECVKDRTTDESLEDILYGDRFCFSSSKYFGSCSTSKTCESRRYSKSRTCGSLVCCEEIGGGSLPGPAWKTTSRPKKSQPNAKPIQALTRGSSCGKLSGVPLIYGGRTAHEGQFPFLVAFTFKKSNGQEETFCGGVLITRKHVLTAAHCFKKAQRRDWARGEVKVRIGVTKLDVKKSDEVVAKIENVNSHSGFKAKAGKRKVGPVNDIAVVTLDRTIYSSSVSTICLPRQGPWSSSYQTVVAGWGKIDGYEDSTSKDLQFAYIRTFSNSECQKKYYQYRANKDSQVDITSNMMCAGDNRTDSCSGDSGGPLMYVDPNTETWTIAGIVSFGPNSCGLWWPSHVCGPKY